MNMGVWLGILATIILFSLVDETWSRESRPIEIEASEVGVLQSISPEESERRLQDATLLFKRGKTDAAIYILQQVQKADPTNCEVLFKLGEMAVGAKNWAYSIQVLREASFLRPDDIELRLILMDIYKAYQMPIQEIIVAKEILVLDPEHVVAAKRLASLYEEQAMQEDEVTIRQLVNRLAPDDYTNLKRLAVIFDISGQLWESAKVYEQIRKHYPDKLVDMRRLAAIYDTLNERFRETQVLDHIAKMGGERGWMQGRAISSIRKQNKIYDPFQIGVMFKKEIESTMRVYGVEPIAKYTHIRVRSSLDLGLETKYSRLHHQGVGILDGEMDIDSTSLLFDAIQNWSGQDYLLKTSVGFIHDEVSGRLFGRNPSDNLTAADFPFLEDPTFKAYGGTIPVGGVSFTARPTVQHMYYNINYEHGLVEELDARLSLFTYDKVSLGANYLADDQTEIQLQVDNSFISDGNLRLHAMASGYYNLWANTSIYDHRGKRKGYYRYPPAFFIRLGYEIEYFIDDQAAQNEKYETFLDSEIRHKGVLISQANLYTIGPDEQILLKIKLAYGRGTTLDYQRGVSAQLSYFRPDSENEFGFTNASLTYSFEEEQSINFTENNLRIGGDTKTHQIALNIEWHF
jgi:tetratricopeptide (TPR) repeat protein